MLPTSTGEPVENGRTIEGLHRRIAGLPQGKRRDHSWEKARPIKSRPLQDLIFCYAIWRVAGVIALRLTLVYLGKRMNGPLHHIFGTACAKTGCDDARYAQNMMTWTS